MRTLRAVTARFRDATGNDQSRHRTLMGLTRCGRLRWRPHQDDGLHCERSGAASVMGLVVALAFAAAGTASAAPPALRWTGAAREVAAAVLIAAAAATPAATVEIPIGVEVAIDVLILI